MILARKSQKTDSTAAHDPYILQWKPQIQKLSDKAAPQNFKNKSAFAQGLYHVRTVNQKKAMQPYAKTPRTSAKESRGAF